MAPALTVQALERRLARSGHRVTEPRRALLAAMGALGDHFTAEDLVGAVDVGRATVFRTLRLLQDIGAVCQVVLDDGSSEYRLSEAGHHHHVVCNRCGAVNDISGCDITDLLQEIASRTGYDIEAHRLEIYGRCATCQQELAAP